MNKDKIRVIVPWLKHLFSKEEYTFHMIQPKCQSPVALGCHLPPVENWTEYQSLTYSSHEESGVDG